MLCDRHPLCEISGLHQKKTVGLISTVRRAKVETDHRQAYTTEYVSIINATIVFGACRFGVDITPVNTWVKVDIVDVLCQC
jgi:hypothetical protein